MQDYVMIPSQPRAANHEGSYPRPTAGALTTSGCFPPGPPSFSAAPESADMHEALNAANIAFPGDAWER